MHPTPEIRKIFWIHIKKSGGNSTRSVLSPVYHTVDRRKWPVNFVQAEPGQYNDILNNHRILIGEYQFRRCLFARDYLYRGEWDDLLKFGFSRNPVDRCLSQFRYLDFEPRRSARLKGLRKSLSTMRFRSNIAWQFDAFLDKLAQAREAKSSLRPHGLHFRTHTAPMWDDVTDENGAIMLDYIYRLEDFRKGINHVFEQVGVSPLDGKSSTHLYRSSSRPFTPDPNQLRRIEDLFAKDFEIYEGHCHRFE